MTEAPSPGTSVTAPQLARTIVGPMGSPEIHHRCTGRSYQADVPRSRDLAAVSKRHLMNHVLQVVYLARHGETAWSLSCQHTGLTDLPLTARGERNARSLGERLQGLMFAAILTSPLQRAARTCQLAGFGAEADVDRDLVEWNYGQYEGRRSSDIRRERPDWQLFRDGCPGGESPDQVGARADRVVIRMRAIQGDVLLFSSGHFLRVLAARWLGLKPEAGRYFLLSTASLSALGYEHDLSQPVIRLWDDTRHVGL
jgi:broad specificity phosphatase PhoE